MITKLTRQDIDAVKKIKKEAFCSDTKDDFTKNLENNQYLFLVSKDDYEKARHNGAYSLIGEEVKKNYLVTNASVASADGKYYLTFWRGFMFGKRGK